ncbi:iron-containing alcohol dehydrogenase [Mucilaginibacter robiniae]|uniref:Iron-containing alcohol dehydrogenase n=1 Tax=Mucilaginibacter robiniae TaxID=2728022 RepID=A0A7L5EA55_9SPHI|nr:iron-containing alcohol dehydrogenase [Mucilaginibacter robiniae]QJD97266.1 iron-containing alcohol dehydrogenase [Mucilaginibacter robiniae]
MAVIQNLTINFPGKLVFGNGCLQQLADEITRYHCRQVFIVTITPLLSQLQELIDQLEQNHISVIINTAIVQEPTFADFSILMQSLGTNQPDMVLGIGGGSVLDVAKLAAAQINNSQTLTEMIGNGMLKQRNTRLICVPTTSGTGSEVSPNAILVDDADNQKKAVISPYLVPDVVYVDPLLTVGVPPSITAATGLDALTHCLEAYTNKFAKPFIDIYAFEGMRLIAANIKQAVQNGADVEAREQVAMGSLLGGFCLGPVNTAAVHALAYPLGSMFHLAHGLSNALLLPYVMEFNAPAATQRYANVAVALGCERQGDDQEMAAAGIAKIKSIIADCNVPARLRDVGIPESAIPEMATDAMKITRLLNNNPRPVTFDDALAIYQAAY